jgi:hypothetical protein
MSLQHRPSPLSCHGTQTAQPGTCSPLPTSSLRIACPPRHQACLEPSRRALLPLKASLVFLPPYALLFTLLSSVARTVCARLARGWMTTGYACAAAQSTINNQSTCPSSKRLGLCRPAVQRLVGSGVQFGLTISW